MSGFQPDAEREPPKFSDEAERQALGKATERRYFLTCKVAIVRFSYQDGQTTDERQQEDEIALLVPEQSSQTDKFLDTWLPADREGHFELAGFIDEPVGSPVRLSIHRKGTHNCDKHHLFVMSPGVEQDLKELRGRLKFWQQNKVKVTIYGEDEEHLADGARRAAIVRQK